MELKRLKVVVRLWTANSVCDPQIFTHTYTHIALITTFLMTHFSRPPHSLWSISNLPTAKISFAHSIALAQIDRLILPSSQAPSKNRNFFFFLCSHHHTGDETTSQRVKRRTHHILSSITLCITPKPQKKSLSANAAEYLFGGLHKMCVWLRSKCIFWHFPFSDFDWEKRLAFDGVPMQKAIRHTTHSAIEFFWRIWDFSSTRPDMQRFPWLFKCRMTFN